LALPVVVVLGMPGLAAADSYLGYGRTGWDYTNKAYCCQDAVAAAQEQATRSCQRTGGYADLRHGGARGHCDWQTARGGNGRQVYSCTASASVECEN
jgi:hypothetical protein